MSPEEFAQLNAFAEKNWKSSQTKQSTKKKKNKGTLLDQLSTGGGIGGALGGAASGAALGSVVPGAGTAIGGLLGAILGGGLGSAGGEVAENAIMGENLGNNVLKEGLIGGATSLPFTAGLKLARAGVKAGSGFGGRSAGELVQEAGVQSIGKRTVAKGGRSGTQFDDGAQDAIQRMSAGRAGGGRMAEMGTDLQRSAANTTKVADSYTQELGILDAFNRNGLKGSASGIYKNIDGTLGNLSGQIDNSLSTVKTSAPRVTVIDALKTNAAEALPQDETYTRELIRSLSRLTKGQSSGQVGPQELFAFKKELGGRLGPAFKKLDRGATLTAKEEVDMALWRNLDDQITKLAPDVKRMTLDQSALITARPGVQSASTKTAGVPLLGIKSQGLEQALQAGRNQAGRTMAGVSSNQAPRAVGQSLLGATTRQFGGRMLTGNDMGVSSDMDSGVEQEPGFQQLTDDPGVQQPPQSLSGYSSAELGQALMKALAAGDEDAAAQLKDMYDVEVEFEATQAESMGGSGKPTTVEGQKAYNNALSGLSALGDVESMLAQDGSLTWKASLPGGGLTDALLGTSSYEAAVRQAQDAMTRLTTGAALTKEETAALNQRMPKAGDTPETIRYKIAAFRDYFNEVMNQPSNLGSGSLAETQRF